MIRALALACTLGLAACASAPAVYGPSMGPKSPGYLEQKIENNRYRVIYRDAPSQILAADYATLRAAEITLAQGYDWFVVDSRSTDRAAAGAGPRVTVGGGTTSYGGRTSVGIGAGVGFNVGQPRGKSTVALDIRMGRGAKPADPNAYDARQVQAMIRARI